MDGHNSGRNMNETNYACKIKNKRGSVRRTKYWVPFLQPLLQCKTIALLIVCVCVCVCVALVILYAMRMRHIVICGLSHSSIFFNITS